MGFESRVDNCPSGHTVAVKDAIQKRLSQEADALEGQGDAGDEADIVGRWTNLHSAVVKTSEVLSMPELLARVEQKREQATQKKVQLAFENAAEKLLMWPEDQALTVEAMESFVTAWPCVSAATSSCTPTAREVVVQL